MHALMYAEGMSIGKHDEVVVTEDYVERGELSQLPE